MVAKPAPAAYLAFLTKHTGTPYIPT